MLARFDLGVTLLHRAKRCCRPLCWTAALLACAPGAVLTQEGAPSALALPHAATRTVLGIISYATWPSPPARVRVCVSGDGAWLAPLLEAPATVGGRPVVAETRADPGVAWVVDCDVLYLGAMPETRRGALLFAAAERPIVTIEAGSPLCAAGSMFCLSPQGDRLSVHPNLDAIARSGVRIHSNVLQLLRKRAPAPRGPASAP